MNIQQFINSKYIDSLSESQKQYLIEHKKFKDRSIVEKRLADKFEDVKFTGRGSDVDIKIGEYKWITTMEFLKEVRERCCYKISRKYTNKDGSTDYGLIDVLAWDPVDFNDNYYPQNVDMVKAQKAINLCELKEDQEMDDETRRYKDYMNLYFIYILTPIRKRENKKARFMKLYYVTVDDSFDPLNLTIDFAIDVAEGKFVKHTDGLANIEYKGPYGYSNCNEYDDDTVTEIELPYIMNAFNGITAHELYDRYNFSFNHERYCDCY